jgi:DNA processing protein
MTENEVLAWLRLQRVPGIGPANGRKLIEHFGDVQTIFEQSFKELVKLPGVGSARAEKLLNPGFLEEAKEEFLKSRQQDIQCLPMADRAYPELLRECPDAPLVLFQKGAVPFSGTRLLSIVGTRSMTDYGRRVCDLLIDVLSPYKPVIISGLAYGVDIYAQKTAIKRGLRTVSCLGHGLDAVYPGTHAKYVPEILEEGALLSEFWLGTTPEPMNFVRRNRIIAGISPATVVIESGLKGGSLITADLAFGYNREVFAVPGRITDPFSSGCNELIGQQKAQLLDSAEELARALDWTKGEATLAQKSKMTQGIPTQELLPDEAQICEFLFENGLQTLDDIALSCTLTIRDAAALLFQLEMKEIVRPHPGKRFELVRH